MSHLLLKDHKAFLVKEDDSIQQIDSVLPYLNAHVEIEQPFTFGDLWQFIAEDYEVYNVIFRHALGGWPLEDFIKESKQEPSERDQDDPTESLGIEQKIKIEMRKEGNETWDQLGFLGWGKDAERFSFSWTPICDMMHYPFNIHQPCKVVTQDYRQSKYNPKITIVETERFPRLFDVLACVLDDITFYGSPKERAATSAEADQAVAEIKDMMEGKDGEAEKDVG